MWKVRRIWRERSPAGAVTRPEWRLLAILLTVGFGVLAIAIRLRMNGNPNGDEPAYLVISQTFQKYHSVDVMKDYNHQDYVAFYKHVPLDAHVVPAPNGRLEPMHNFGGPLLWLIPFMIWGRIGAAGFMGAVTLLILWNIYYFLRERGISINYAALTTLLFTIGTPIYVYGSMTFIEPIGALLLLYAVRVLLGPRLSTLRVLVASLALGYLPWVHPRFLVFALTVGALLLLRLYWESTAPPYRSWLPVLVPIGLSLVLIVVYNKLEWGTLSPVSNMSGANAGPFEISPISGFKGLLFDRQVGLISSFPIFLLTLPGLLLSLDRSRAPVHVAMAAIALPYLLLISTFRLWMAGTSPPARYIMLLLPLGSYYIAYALERIRSVALECFAVLCAMGAYALALTSDIRPDLRYAGRSTANEAMNTLGRLVNIHFAGHIPSARVATSPLRFTVATCGLVLVGALLALYGLRNRRLAPEVWPDRERRGAHPDTQPEPPEDPSPLPSG